MNYALQMWAYSRMLRIMWTEQNIKELILKDMVFIKDYLPYAVSNLQFFTHNSMSARMQLGKIHCLGKSWKTKMLGKICNTMDKSGRKENKQNTGPTVMQKLGRMETYPTAWWVANFQHWKKDLMMMTSLLWFIGGTIDYMYSKMKLNVQYKIVT